MLNKLAKAVLISTSASPIFFASAVARMLSGAGAPEIIILFALAVLLACIALKMTANAARSLQASRIEIKKAKSSDKEILAFFVAYASPIFLSKIIEVSTLDILIYGGMIIFVLLGTNSLNVNPILGLFGYNYYEVDSDDGISYLMISKRKIYDIKEIKSVVQLTEYAIIDRNEHP